MCLVRLDLTPADYFSHKSLRGSSPGGILLVEEGTLMI
jgi:hypothetical protein